MTSEKNNQSSKVKNSSRGDLFQHDNNDRPGFDASFHDHKIITKNFFNGTEIITPINSLYTSFSL